MTAYGFGPGDLGRLERGELEYPTDWRTRHADVRADIVTGKRLAAAIVTQLDAAYGESENAGQVERRVVLCVGNVMDLASTLRALLRTSAIRQDQDAAEDSQQWFVIDTR